MKEENILECEEMYLSNGCFCGTRIIEVNPILLISIIKDL